MSYCFGIDIGGTTVKCGLFTTEGVLLEKWEIKTRTEENGKAILPDVAETILKKMEEKRMGIDMKAFMKPELKDRGTMEFPGIERYKDAKGNVIPFIIKRLSMKEIKEIRNNYKTKEVYRDKRNGDRPIIGNNGQVAVINDYDGDSAGLEIMVEAFVQPKLDDPELMEYYGVHDRLDMPNIIFPDKDDFKYADDCLMEACGLASKKNDKETVEELKK